MVSIKMRLKATLRVSRNELPAKKAPDTAPSDNATGTPPGSGEPTGFVNPLRNSEQDIHWGSDGDRNLNSTGGFYGDESEIESNMGMAIAVTVFGALCCSNCITIMPEGYSVRSVSKLALSSSFILAVGK